jgi:hypothetical protein
VQKAHAAQDPKIARDVQAGGAAISRAAAGPMSAGVPDLQASFADIEALAASITSLSSTKPPPRTTTPNAHTGERHAMRRRRLHLLAAALLLAAGSVAVAGCTAQPAGGQSVANAQKALARIPGVAHADVHDKTDMSGFTKYYTPEVTVALDDGYRIADLPALTDFLIRTAWSVNDRKPHISLSVEIDSAGELNLAAAAASGGWLSSAAAVSSNEIPGWLHLVTIDEPAKSKLGAWPGKAPTLPDGVIVKK